jgi:hypothetical protein
MPKTFAVMATYAKRMSYCPKAVESIIGQVDRLYIVANEMTKSEIRRHVGKEAHVVIPATDLKDTGKFFIPFSADNDVVLCDDDIVYPPDYVSQMRFVHSEFQQHSAVIGVHGVTYSDFFDGAPDSRVVNVFHRALDTRRYVNQLGTGTVFCKGFQMPTFSFMETSARFVDLRFAVHCHRKGYPRICINRPEKWLQELDTGDSLFETFTREWPSHVTREAQEISGMRFLPNGGYVL